MSGLLERPNLVDSHCHLDVEQFESDRDAVLERASAASVGLIIVPGIDLATMRQPITLADAQPGVFAAVGVHPTSCAGFDEASVEKLRRLAQHPKVVAIGEIGLDYYWDTVAREQQHLALKAQLSLAAELGLPVIIHSRDSNEDVAAMLGDWANSDEVRRSPLSRATLQRRAARLQRRSCSGGASLQLGVCVELGRSRHL